MTAPAPAGLDWRAVLEAGMAAYGIAVTATTAAPIGCCCGEFICPDGGHLWLAPTPAQQSAWEQNGGQP